RRIVFQQRSTDQDTCRPVDTVPGIGAATVALRQQPQQPIEVVAICPGQQPLTDLLRVIDSAIEVGVILPVPDNGVAGGLQWCAGGRFRRPAQGAADTAGQGGAADQI